MSTIPKLITINETANKLVCSVSTVRRYKKLGILGYTSINGRLLFKENEIEELIEKSSIKPNN